MNADVVSALADVLVKHTLRQPFTDPLQCNCGEELPGRNTMAAHVNHIAAVAIAHLTAEGWTQGREEEWGTRDRGGYIHMRRDKKDAEEWADIIRATVVRRRVTDWEEA